jgi:hypothetical protein
LCQNLCNPYVAGALAHFTGIETTMLKWQAENWTEFGHDRVPDRLARSLQKPVFASEE